MSNNNNNTESTDVQLFVMTFRFVSDPNAAFITSPVDEPVVRQAMTMWRDKTAQAMQIPVNDGSVLHLTPDVMKNLVMTFKSHTEEQETIDQE